MLYTVIYQRDTNQIRVLEPYDPTTGYAIPSSCARWDTSKEDILAEFSGPFWEPEPNCTFLGVHIDWGQAPILRWDLWVRSADNAIIARYGQGNDFYNSLDNTEHYIFYVANQIMQNGA